MCGRGSRRKTENAIPRLPFKAAYMFRPGFIQSVNGELIEDRAHRAAYTITRPLLPLLQWAIPAHIATTEEVGKAMIAVAKRGAEKKILENKDIRVLAAS